MEHIHLVCFLCCLYIYVPNIYVTQGMIALLLDTIERFSHFKSRRHFAYYAGEEVAEYYEDLSSKLYLLLGM